MGFGQTIFSQLTFIRGSLIPVPCSGSPLLDRRAPLQVHQAGPGLRGAGHLHSQADRPGQAGEVDLQRQGKFINE